MRRSRPLVASLLALALAACGASEAPVPAPMNPPTGSLLVLETRACNFLRPPDPARCDDAGLTRLGLNGDRLDELTPEVPIALGSFALAPQRDAIAWQWNWELWVMALDGSDPRLVNERLLPETLGEQVFDPVWSPDASQILYRWWGVDEAHTWYRIEVASGELEQLAMPVDCWAMSWAPDGQTVACEVPRRFQAPGNEVERADIALVDLSTLEVTPITEPEDAVDDRRPEFSPDGRWLAVSRWTDDGTRAEDTAGIWLVEVASGDARRIASGRLSAPTWSPDGGHLAAYDDTSEQIVIIARDGSELTPLDHEPRRYVVPRWLPDDA